MISDFAHRGSAAVKDRVPEGDRTNKVWSAGELSALETYFEMQYSDIVIARMLRRSLQAVKWKRCELGLTVDGYTVTDVAKMLGWHVSTVLLLITRGHVRARKNGSAKPRKTIKAGDHRWWLIQDDDLEVFLRDPLNWHTWTPAADDLAVREWMEECRGVPYLTIRDAIEQFGGPIDPVRWTRLITKLGLPKRRDFQGRCILTRDEAIQIASYRPRMREWTTPEVRRLMTMFRSGVTIKQIALTLGRTPTAIRCRISALNGTTKQQGRAA